MWSAREQAVVDRYVRALVAGRFRSASAAARACGLALAKLRLPTRTERAVQQRLICTARAAVASRPFSPRQPHETRLARRYVRAYLAGRYPSLRAAAQECTRELARGSRSPRSFFGVYAFIHTTAHALGVPCLTEPWTPAERRVLDRHVRRLIEGRYRLAPEAAAECHRALGGTRTYRAICNAVRMRAEELGLPRAHGDLTAAEQRLIERYALKVHHGLLPEWKTAARECHAAMQRMNARLAKTHPFRPRRVGGHAFESIYNTMRRLARRRGLHGPRHPHWSAVENKVAAGWVAWYGRYRHVRRLTPLRQAARGIHEDLAERGLHRTVAACTARLVLIWRRQTQG